MNVKTPVHEAINIDLDGLGALLLIGLGVGQRQAAHHEDNQHDGQLEECVQGIGKHLCCCQAQGLNQYHTLPEPEPRSADTTVVERVCRV